MSALRGHLALLIAVMAGVAVMVLLRLHTWAEPLERDIDIYLQVARGLLDGGALYSEWVDIKPPPTFIAYALALAALPTPEAAVFGLGVLCALGTLAGVVVLVRAVLPGSNLAAIAAGLLWALLGSDLHFQANQPNTEVLLNLTFVWGCALAWRGAWWRAGALFGLAVLTKQLMLLPLLLLVPVLVLQARLPRRQQLLSGLALLLPAVLLWLVTTAWFAATGRVADFLHLMLVYPGEYAVSDGRDGLLDNLIAAMGRGSLGEAGIQLPMLLGLGALAAAIATTAVARQWRLVGLLLAWAAGIWLAVVLPGHGYAHYFQLWLPLFALALAVLVAASTRRRAWLGVALTIAVIVPAGLRLASQWQLSPQEWSRAKYGPQFVVAEEIARELAPMLRPEDRIFVWGVFPGVYRVLQRTPPTGLVNVWMTLPQYGGRRAGQWSAQLLRDLDAASPDFVLVDRVTLGHTAADHPIQAWLREYAVFARTELFLIAVRRDSEAQAHLRARLARAAGSERRSQSGPESESNTQPGAAPESRATPAGASGAPRPED